MDKSLIELSKEYEKSADILSGRIRERNGKLKFTKPGSTAESLLRAELSILYAERRDAVKTAYRLKNYYA
jgi:hypothetical protein